MILFIIILLIILLLCLSYINSDYDEHMTNCTTDDNKPYLFMYWEFKPGVTQLPDYIKLCLKTIMKNGKLFNIKLLNEKTVLDWLPDLRTDINQLPLALKSDYIRIALLHKYGGVWLDVDTIMMNDMHELIDVLNNGEDFIGFGCTGYQCDNGYGRPSNQAMASKKGGIMVQNCLEALDSKLDVYFSSEDRKELDYFELGKLVIWDQFDKLVKNQNYKYYHFTSEYDGSRDINKLWIARETINRENIDLLDENKAMVVFLVNSAFCGKDPEWNWFCSMTEDQILNGNMFISKMFRKALNY